MNGRLIFLTILFYYLYCITHHQAQGDSVGRVRYQMLEKMLRPCGKPPVSVDMDE